MRWLALLLALVGCRIDGFRLEGEPLGPDGGARADARPDAAVGDARPGHDAPPGCVAQPERCDGQDNDCDGVSDNGFNLALDPQNCGGCGIACNKGGPNERGSCIEGDCHYFCSPGFLDCSQTLPGCEYPCIRTNGGLEACDGLDNNCDCQVDEGFNTQTDPMNCGVCGHVCVALHAQSGCQGGQCTVGACEPGYRDLRPDIVGCEYRCPVFPAAGSDATCDGVDDDCDGVKDDDVPGVGDACPVTGATGECAVGEKRCLNGGIVCQQVKIAQPEVCDGKDNDCNGAIDNGFDKLSDPANCGPSCTRCSFPHALPACDQGTCKILVCEPGFADLSPDVPGCEYECTPSGPEVCDGLDNDCDGKTDEADPDLFRPATNFCDDDGACAGATLRCSAEPAGCPDTTVAWRCVYPAGAEVDGCGNLVAQETLCDNRDGDCDGAVDDAFPQKGAPCDDGGLGVCRATGSFACDASDPLKKRVICVIDQPGGTPSDERCNGKDDDCDGQVDDGATDDLVHVVSGALDFWIYQYEASHPDATATTRGASDARACSQPDVLPWSLVTWTEADAACAAAGKRLCTEAEWMAACMGSAGTEYPYGDAYQPLFCNGNDYDPDCTGPEDDIALPVGAPHGCPKPAASRCVSSWGAAGNIYDMSGNVREWTDTPVGGFRRIRGGGYDNVAVALTCTFDFWAQEEGSFNFNLGFRCCADEDDQ